MSSYPVRFRIAFAVLSEEESWQVPPDQRFRQDVASYIQRDALWNAIAVHIAKARRMGDSSVPHYIIGIKQAHLGIRNMRGDYPKAKNLNWAPHVIIERVPPADCEHWGAEALWVEINSVDDLEPLGFAKEVKEQCPTITEESEGESRSSLDKRSSRYSFTSFEDI